MPLETSTRKSGLDILDSFFSESKSDDKKLTAEEDINYESEAKSGLDLLDSFFEGSTVEDVKSRLELQDFTSAEDTKGIIDTKADKSSMRLSETSYSPYSPEGVFASVFPGVSKEEGPAEEKEITQPHKTGLALLHETEGVYNPPTERGIYTLEGSISGPVERFLGGVTEKIFGYNAFEKITPAAAAQAFMQLRAKDAGMSLKEYKNTVSPQMLAVEEAAGAFVNAVTLGFGYTLKEALTGEQYVEPSHPADQIGTAVGELAGFIAGPIKIGEKLLKPVFKYIPKAAQSGRLAERILKTSLRDALLIGTASSIRSTGEVAGQTTFTQAADVLWNNFKSGAMVGGIFGVVKGMFPKEGAQTAARMLTGLIGLNAYRAKQIGGNPFTDRPLELVAFDTLMDVFFLYRGLPKDARTRLPKDLEDLAKRMEEVDKIREALPKLESEEGVSPEVLKKARERVAEVDRMQKELEEKLEAIKAKAKTDIESKLEGEAKAKEIQAIKDGKIVEPLNELKKTEVEKAPWKKTKDEYIADEETRAAEEDMRLDFIEQEVARGKSLEDIAGRLGEPVEDVSRSYKEFIEGGRKSAKSLNLESSYEAAIRQAFMSGEKIPRKILAQFPDLKKAVREGKKVKKQEPKTPPVEETKQPQKEAEAKPAEAEIEKEIEEFKAELPKSPKTYPSQVKTMEAKGEAIVKSGKYRKKAPAEPKKSTKRKLKTAEPANDIDLETGEPLPEKLSTDKHPLRNKDVKNTNEIRAVLQERVNAVDISPEVFTRYLINEVNRYLNGEKVDIDKVRFGLSELAARAGNLRMKFDKQEDFLFWKAFVSDAASWARKAERSVTEDSETRLNMMIPVNEAPKIVKDLLKNMRAGFSLYRNKEVFDKTGFWLGKDGKWRYEIGPEEIKINLNNIPWSMDYRKSDSLYANLSDVIDSPKLFSAVPNIDKVKVLVTNTGKALGDYQSTDNLIRISSYQDRSTFTHELQHAINDIVGSKFRGSDITVEQAKFDTEIFNRLRKAAKTEEVKSLIDKAATQYDVRNKNILESAMRKMMEVSKDPHERNAIGGALRDYINTSPFENYLKDPGEMEARLASERMEMTPEQRKSEPPWETLDTLLDVEGFGDGYGTTGPVKAGLKLYSGIDVPEATKKIKEAIKKIKVAYTKESSKWGKDAVIFTHPEGEAIYYKEGNKYKFPIFTDIGVSREGQKIGTALMNKVFEDMKKNGNRIFYTNEVTSDGIALFEAQERLGKIRLIKEEEVPYDQNNPNGGTYFERMYEIKDLPNPITLYSGVDPTEGVKQIVNGAKALAAYTAKARGMKKWKPKEAAKMLRENAVKYFIDRSGNIRRDLLEELQDEGYNIVQALYLTKGSTSLASEYLVQMRKEVYEGLSKEDKKILDNIILASRILDIAKYKTPSQFAYPKGITPTECAAYYELFPYIEKISLGKAEKLLQRADAYFKWMKKPLEDMLEAELITQEEYDSLVSHNYRRLKLVEVLDKRYSAKVGGRKVTVYDSGIEALSHGRGTDVFEPSSEVMALEVFNRAYGRILNNAANRTLLDLARNNKDNPFVAVKESPSDHIPSGWQRIFVYTGGQRQALYLSPKMAGEWITNNREMSYVMSQFLRYASMSPVLRTFATGINWGFALANLPRDTMHIWYAARYFENGKWKSVYSPHLPVYQAQMTADIARVAKDAITKTGRYIDYIKEGGGMEFLVLQGRIMQRGRHIEGELDAVQDVLGYPGEVSEIITRLAVRDRVIMKRAKQLGISYEEAYKNKKITREATFVARDYMDFGQGGTITKALDNAIPYLNAGVQGTRGLLRAFKDNPLVSTYKLMQFAALVTGLYIANQKRCPETMKALKGNINMQNNLIIPIGDEFGFYDKTGQKRYPFVKIPLDPGQRFFKIFFEASYDKLTGKEVDVKGVVNSFKQISPIDTSMLPPSVSATLGYIQNRDFWANENIWKRSKPIEWPRSNVEVVPGVTPQAMIDIGNLTGLSPERLRYSLEELVTSGSQWSWLAGQGYDLMFKDTSQDVKSLYVANMWEKLADYPIVNRFVGLTNPVTQYIQNIERHEEDAAIEKLKLDTGLKMKVDAYLYEGGKRSDVLNYIKENAKDYATFERLRDNFEFQEKIKNLENRSFWILMKNVPDTEARAKIFVDRYWPATEKEKEAIRKEMAIVELAGGIISDPFKEAVGRLINERSMEAEQIVED